MAKKIRVPLEMKDGAKAHTLAEMKEHWDVEKIVAHFSSGKLMTWLRDRPYENERAQVEALDEKDAELRQKLSAIFGMEYEAGNNAADDVETVRDKQDRLNRLRQATTDKDILDDVDHAAFDQDDLWNIMSEGAKKVYLVNNTFEISLTDRDMTYIGIGKAIAKIDSKEFVDFDALDIKFENVTFIEEFGKAYWGEKYYRDSNVAFDEKNYDKAREFAQKSADAGHAGGMCVLGICYDKGWGCNQDSKKAVNWYQKAAEAGDNCAMNQLGWAYSEGKGIAQNKKKAAEWFRKGAEAGWADAMSNLGWLYERGEGVNQDRKEAVKWYRKAAEAGSASGMNNLGLAYEEGNGVEQNEDEAMKWYRKAAELGNGCAAWNISVTYDKKGDSDKAEKWRKKAKELGYEKEDSSGCFITTAVCGSFAKPDDCYELTMFRYFRDSWLRQQSGGAALIQEYYETAPRIVAAIDRLHEAKEVYRAIWDEYLCPCLRYLEQREFEECKKLYVKMVSNLQERFLV